MENGTPTPAAPATPSPAAPPAAPGGEAPAAPAAPTTPPAPPAAPAQPAQPAQPATPAPEAPKQPGADEPSAEDKEWEDAENELFPGVRSTQKKEPGKDEPAKPKENGEEEPATPPNPTDKKPDEEPGAGDDTEAKDAADKQAAAAARDARSIARQTEQQLAAIKTDVRAKVFPNVPTELQDAAGDPIRSVEDVMLLKDPRTGEAFTREAAEAWFTQATAQFKDQLAKVEAAVADISNVNLALKDEADYINETYGELLKADDALRVRLWAEYEKTLTKDPETGIIVKAPVSLQSFYDIALKPYAEAAKKAKEEAAAAAAPTPPATPPAPAANDGKPQTPPATRDQKRTDRSDIYAPNNQPAEDSEDKEWGEAARVVFGDQLKK